MVLISHKSKIVTQTIATVSPALSTNIHDMGYISHIENRVSVAPVRTIIAAKAPINTFIFFSF